MSSFSAAQRAAARAHARQVTACNLTTHFDTIVVDFAERFDATRGRAAAVGLDAQFSPAVDRRSDPAVLSRIAPILPFLRSNDSCRFNFANEIAKKIAMWHARQRAYARAAQSSRPTLVLESDAAFIGSRCSAAAAFCRRASALLDALKKNSRDILYLGHCYEAYDKVQTCYRLPELFLTRSIRPKCTHAMLYTPKSAGRMHAALSHWDQSFVGRFVREGAEKAWRRTMDGCKRIHPQLAGADVDVAHQAHRERAYLVSPPLIQQAWIQVVPEGHPGLPVLPQACRHAQPLETPTSGNKLA